jgi:hypothetical protein
VIDVATGKPLSALVGNDGAIKANGGRIQLTAVAARKVVDSVINNTGVLEANAVGTRAGKIVLGAATAASKPKGAPTQTVRLSGTISASGKSKGSTGGTVQVTGEKVVVTAANVDVSGDAGGGKVLLGGDWGGRQAGAWTREKFKCATRIFRDSDRNDRERRCGDHNQCVGNRQRQWRQGHRMVGHRDCILRHDLGRRRRAIRHRRIC